MPNWPNKKLGEITTKIGSGSMPRGGEAVYTKTGVPLIRLMNVHFAELKPDGFVWSNSTRSLKI